MTATLDINDTADLSQQIKDEEQRHAYHAATEILDEYHNAHFLRTAEIELIRRIKRWAKARADLLDQAKRDAANQHLNQQITDFSAENTQLPTSSPQSDAKSEKNPKSQPNPTKRGPGRPKGSKNRTTTPRAPSKS